MLKSAKFVSLSSIVVCFCNVLLLWHILLGSYIESTDPVIKLMTMEVSVGATTSIATQDTQPTAMSVAMLTIIAIAVFGGVVVLIFIMTVSGIVICCVLYRKMREISANQPQVSGPLPASQLVDNPSYNVGDNDLQLMSNQSYNQVLNFINDSELVNNPAYNNSNDLEDPYYSVVH